MARKCSYQNSRVGARGTSRANPSRTHPAACAAFRHTFVIQQSYILLYGEPKLLILTALHSPARPLYAPVWLTSGGSSVALRTDSTTRGRANRSPVCSIPIVGVS